MYSIDSNGNLVVTSSASCGTFLGFAKFIAENKFAFCGILFVIGLILLFIGGSKWDSLLAVTGFLVGAGFIVFVFTQLANVPDKPVSYVLIISAAIIVGFLIGCLCKKVTIVSYILLGFVAGFVLSNSLLILF